jgi:hypothetical protein
MERSRYMDTIEYLLIKQSGDAVILELVDLSVDSVSPFHAHDNASAIGIPVKLRLRQVSVQNFDDFNGKHLE